VKTHLIFIAVLLLSFACENDEPKAPLALLTLIVDESFETSDTDNWVIIHDEDGTPITFESFETGDVKIITTSELVKGQTIAVTIIKHVWEYGTERYIANTYFHYQKGGELKLNYFTPPITGASTFSGTFDITVNSTGPLHQYAVTNQHAMGSSWQQYDKPSFTVTAYLSDLIPKFLLQASDLEGNIRYRILDNPQANDSYTFSFDELSEFDHTVEFNFPESNEVYFYITGRESDQSIEPPSYLHQLHFGTDFHKSIKGGYLNSLAKYVTEISVGYPTYKFFYRNKGSIPQENISALSPEGYAILSNDIQDFYATSTAPFIYRKSNFGFSESSNNLEVNWYVYSSLGSHKLTELPAGIITNHPKLSIVNMKHLSTQFYVESLPYERAILPEWENESYVSRGIIIY
jgi:hypothetical protein